MRFPSLCFLFIVSVCCVLWSPAHAAPRTGDDSILGLWMTEDNDAVIQFYNCGADLCGRFHWIDDKDDKRDEHNHEVTLRNRPLCQMQFIGDFKKDEQGNFVDGWIYNPNDGWKYNATITVVDHDTLNLNGYLLLPILGQSQTWTRVQSHSACKVVS